MENRYVYISKAYFQLLVADIFIFMSDSDPGNSYICIFDQADNSSTYRLKMRLLEADLSVLWSIQQLYKQIYVLCVYHHKLSHANKHIYISFMKHIHQLCMHIGKRKCLPSKSIFCMQICWFHVKISIRKPVYCIFNQANISASDAAFRSRFICFECFTTNCRTPTFQGKIADRYEFSHIT